MWAHGWQFWRFLRRWKIGSGRCATIMVAGGFSAVPGLVAGHTSDAVPPNRQDCQPVAVRIAAIRKAVESKEETALQRSGVVYRLAQWFNFGNFNAPPQQFQSPPN